MKETVKNNIHTASMVALMAVSLAASLNGFAWIIHAAEAPEETAAPSECVGVGREVVHEVGFFNETIADETVVETVSAKIQRRYALTDDERRVVECVVMGEAEGESYEGKVLVAQCILNACEKDGIKPSEVVEKYSYAGWNDEPSDEVVQAVASVFDSGFGVTDENILYFYAPKYCTSRFHESQRYVLTEGGHRFFAEW